MPALKGIPVMALIPKTVSAGKLLTVIAVTGNATDVSSFVQENKMLLKVSNNKKGFKICLIIYIFLDFCILSVAKNVLPGKLGRLRASM